MTIRALPSDMLAHLIPALVEIERTHCTEEFCFICFRVTDHFGEHSDAQILAIFDATQTYSRECEQEFGPHTDHAECERILADMSADYDFTDYSDWYGGERGYNDGLRWSDFV